MPRRYKIYQFSAKALASYAEEKENDVYEYKLSAAATERCKTYTAKHEQSDNALFYQIMSVIKGEDFKIDKDALFKKYLDCFATIISIGIDKNYTSVEEISIKPNDYCLSDQFLNLFIDINDLIISTSEDHYITLVEDFLSLGITLGYSKNQINESFLNT